MGERIREWTWLGLAACFLALAWVTAARGLAIASASMFGWCMARWASPGRFR